MSISIFFIQLNNLYKNLKIHCSQFQTQSVIFPRMSVRLSFSKKSWRLSIYNKDFTTLDGVPVAGGSHWSSKRRYASPADLQILQPYRKQAQVISLNLKSVPCGKNSKNCSQLFLGHRSSCHINKSPIYLVRLSLLGMLA